MTDRNATLEELLILLIPVGHIADKSSVIINQAYTANSSAKPIKARPLMSMEIPAYAFASAES